jgi:hypothetical protein
MPSKPINKKFSLQEYKDMQEMKRSNQCKQCNQTFASRHGLNRHEHKKHQDKPCTYFNCWSCGIQFNRKDNYSRHNKTLRHQRKIEEYLLPKETTAENENLQVMTTTDAWYSQIQEIEDVPEAKSYSYHQKELNSVPTEIPLYSHINANLADPRNLQDKFLESIGMDNINFSSTIQLHKEEGIGLVISAEEIDCMFADIKTKPCDWPWTHTTFIEQEKEVDEIQESFMEFLGKEQTTEEILTEFINCTFSDVDNSTATDITTEEPYTQGNLTEFTNTTTDVETMIDATTEPMGHTPTDDIQIGFDDDFISLSIMDFDTNDAWFTLDNIGTTDNPEELLPPVDFMNI